MYTCTVCEEDQPADQFRFQMRRGKKVRVAMCKGCKSKKDKAHYEANKERHAEYMKSYYAANGERLREYRREYGRQNAEQLRAKKRARQPLNTVQQRHWLWVNKYGLTVEQGQELLQSQGGGCAICGKTAEPNGKHLAVDHDHITGRVRGFLCTNCNNGLGRFEDDPERLARAAEYISANIRSQT